MEMFLNELGVVLEGTRVLECFLWGLELDLYMTQ